MPKNTTTEQEVRSENAGMEEMMRKLEAMQDDIARRMLELQSKEEALKAKAIPAEPAKKMAPAVPPYDPTWDEKVEIELDLAPAGDEQYLQVGVNGRRYQVPRGKPVLVPRPLYERIRIMQKTERAAAMYRRNLSKESYPGEVTRV